MAAKEIKLKVAEAIQDDVNKGVVRIDSVLMREMGIRAGDVVEITGEKSTVGIVDRAYPGDIGLNIIRMDGLLRRNAKTGIGEQVIVAPASVKEAKSVVIAPARKDIVVKADPLFFKRGLIGRAVTKGDIISLGNRNRRRKGTSGSPFFEDIVELLDEGVMSSFGFSDLKFIVVETNPKQAVIITELSEIIYNPEAVEQVVQEAVFDVSYEDIGGLRDEVKKIREMIDLPIKHPEVFDRLGIEPPKGVLLHGPPGTGKTLLAKAVANETKSHFILINGPEIMSKFYGQSEENLRKKFEEAEANAPSIIFIDEIDAIASKREETHGEVEKRVVAQLLAVMDGLKNRGKVVVIAATNIPNSIDPALRRPGRFDREIEIGVPKETDRLEILKVHTRTMPLAPPFDPVIAKKTIEEFNEKLEKDLSTIEIEIKNINKDIARREEEIKQLHKQLENAKAEQQSKSAVERVGHQIKNLFTEDNRLKTLVEKLNEKETLKAKDKEKVQQRIEELRLIRDKINNVIKSDDPERGLFGLTYVDFKQITDSTIAMIIEEIRTRFAKEELPFIDDLADITSMKDIKEKIIGGLESDDARRALIENVLSEINIDLDNFQFSREGLLKIIPSLNDKVLADYLKNIVENTKTDADVNEIIGASWINEELKDKIKANLVEQMLLWVAKITHGFVGADLASLAKESAMLVLRRITSDIKDREESDITKYLDKLNISHSDFKEALKTVRPSALREVLIELPNVSWEAIGGLDTVKQDLKEAVEWPLRHPGMFSRLGVRAPRGILLYGPPGTGKTMLAKAVATESESNFILIKGPELLSKWVGESEKAVRKIFEKARQTSPTIIFFDEVDSIAPRRGISSDSNVTERVVNQMLTEMDGLEELNDVVIIAATNRPDILDTALLRPGRFDRIILVPAPDMSARTEIFKVHTANMPLDLRIIKDSSEKRHAFCHILARKTEGYVGADIESVCREAAIRALRADIKAESVTMDHFDIALKKVVPSVTKDIAESYENLQQFFTSAKARQLAKEKPAYFG